MSKLTPALILHDIHAPFHDKRAWRLMLKVARKLKPGLVVVNGDFLDCFCISSHSKSPDRGGKGLKSEVEEGRRLLDQLDSLGADDKVFVAGNHEDRLRRYLEEKAPQLFGLVDIPGLLELRERGWQYVPYKHHTKRGKLHITHDVGYCGRYASARALDTYQHSITTGHTHRFQYLVEGNAAGEQKLSASFGWLGDAKAVDYMHRAQVLKNWALGFGIGYLDESNGLVYLTPVPIVRRSNSSYSACVNGEIFVA